MIDKRKSYTESYKQHYWLFDSESENEISDDEESNYEVAGNGESDHKKFDHEESDTEEPGLVIQRTAKHAQRKN